MSKKKIADRQEKNMKIKPIILIMSAAGLLLSGCGEDIAPELNTVLRKEYTETETSAETTVPSETGGSAYGTAEVSGDIIEETAPSGELSEVSGTETASGTDSPFGETVTAKNLLSSEGGNVIVDESLPVTEEPSQAVISSSASYYALNYPTQCGMWFSYLEYERIMKGQSEEVFTGYVREAFDNMLSIGVNTVYVQLRPFGDAYYESDIFPKGSCFTGSYDPLEIMVKEAHSRGLSVHGWINPMRLMTSEQMSELSSSYIIKQWFDSGVNMYEYDGRMYLDPSKEEVRSLICAGVTEILEKYDVDGIQIDDYFYPTADPDWDRESFAVCGENITQEEFRRNAVTQMVRDIYSAVHRANDSAVFGISPSGNAEADYSQLFADVYLFCGSGDCCDYICPQIYYGLSHESRPFEETLLEWKAMCCDSVSLVAGIGAYKAGTEDAYAGTGRNEWKDNTDIISKEMKIAADNGCGMALFRYDSLFSPAPDVRESVEKELELITVNSEQ
ncbi:MAG: family 10 glycosylhydrolase [Oscillospiraceae bacterium]|nr:family 10 glycosylhydrolase [Oscillospiraceae bacterium]